ncbi:MAG TPA: DUF4158 domain-containing protein [Anaeromyxobacteraceae bacterium]|nr:DUF4158 domain-containing protein [Anaeromyxobacteraceae bacterium]
MRLRSNIEAFFTFFEAERRVIDERRRPELKLGLALQMGFLKMSGRLLDGVGAVPPALWRHLGAQFELTTPDLASLRVMYRRPRTLFQRQELARTTLGFPELTEAGAARSCAWCAMSCRGRVIANG